MQRMQLDPRHKWQQTMEKELGFYYHSFPSEDEWRMDAYWQEKAMYVFTADQVDTLEQAGIECYDRYVSMVDKLLDKENGLSELGIDPRWHQHIKTSWNRGPDGDPSLIGRFDFAYDGINPPKLLEFNADTPTSLYEASIVQWHAKEARFGSNYDQFNSIHEQLTASWKDMKENYLVNDCTFTSYPNNEDITNAWYAMRVAQNAEIKTNYVAINDLGHSYNGKLLYGENDVQIQNLYKLWPFEYFIQDDAYMFEQSLEHTNYIEPIWKMAMSTKAALPVLSKQNRSSPYILNSYNTEKQAKDKLGGNYVKKPVISREGEGVTLIENGRIICESEEAFEEENRRFVYQELAKLPSFKDTRDKDVYNPVIGIWVIGGEICGMGIRENRGLITDNNSMFVPHIFVHNDDEMEKLKRHNIFSMNVG